MQVDLRASSRFSSRIPRRALTDIAQRALVAQGIDATVTIYITGDAEIRKLNRQFHAANAPTDVLSFPAEPVAPVEVGKRGRPPYLGDIVISYERARAQARAAGWYIKDELELLIVHGILHLTGYDDLHHRARARMWKRQQELLGKEIPGDKSSVR